VNSNFNANDLDPCASHEFTMTIKRYVAIGNDNEVTINKI